MISPPPLLHPRSDRAAPQTTHSQHHHWHERCEHEYTRPGHRHRQQRRQVDSVNSSSGSGPGSCPGHVGMSRLTCTQIIDVLHPSLLSPSLCMSPANPLWLQTWISKDQKRQPLPPPLQQQICSMETISNSNTSSLPAQPGTNTFFLEQHHHLCESR